MMKKIVPLLTVFFLTQKSGAQTKNDSLLTGTKPYSLHVQTTAIPQYHFDFKAPCSGANSMAPVEGVSTSVSTTLYLNYKLRSNTYLVFNPEAAGGRGLSKTMGIAGFPNGEVYRVGDPTPKPFIGRLYLEQRIALSNQMTTVEDDLNQVAETTHQDYISMIAGKFSLTDFFDNSATSCDPRTQFFNWSLMGNGGWDYPANTRGYTMGIVLQALYHDWALRSAITTVPTEANGPDLQFRWGKAMGWVLEMEKTHLFKQSERRFTTLHLGVFSNQAHMGNYITSISKALPGMAPDITDSREYGRKKWGFYASADHHENNLHFFFKASINDGKNETWAFTEIDQSLAAGIQLDGAVWNRKMDKLGIAYVNNQLSSDHHTYLEKGGYGFLIGDGKLNYGAEQILETYYSFNLWKQIYISPDYQFVLHPAYNKDRGPVHIIGLRLHVEF